MKFQFLILFLIPILLLIPVISAQTELEKKYVILYEKYSHGIGEDRTDYLKVTYYNQTFSGALEHNDQITEFDKIPMSFYGEKFKIRDIDKKIIILGQNIEAKNYTLSILLLDEREELNFRMFSLGEKQIIQRFTNIPSYIQNQNPVDPLIKLEEWKESQKITGPIHVETQKRLESEKLLQKQEEKRLQDIKDRLSSKDKYILSDDKEIKILVDTLRKVAYYKPFSFDLRVVDPSINKFNSYWERVGYIDDVEIISTIKDPNGKILNEFTGKTTDSGTFSSKTGTTFSYNTFLNGAYTLNILATKYFDDDATYSIDSLIKEFFVYVPTTTSDLIAPTGTIEIKKSEAGITNNLTPELTLTCIDVNGCSTMAFAINSPDFSESKSYPFKETFTYPEKLIKDKSYKIYVQYSDENKHVSVVDIFDTVKIPKGTIEIKKSEAGITNSLTPELTLTCIDADGCSTMAFAINSPDFSESKSYPFEKTFTYPEKLIKNKLYKIYVQYSDDNKHVSVVDIFDTVKTSIDSS